MNVFGSHCERPTRRPHLPIRPVLELVGLWRYRDRSIAMLISSHQLNELQELCGRFLFIKDGRACGRIRRRTEADHGYRAWPAARCRETCGGRGFESGRRHSY